jgi:hypothetical protein
MSAYDSDDLTELIEENSNEFVVLRSADSAGHSPDYEELGRFPTRKQAEDFLATHAP